MGGSTYMVQVSIDGEYSHTLIHSVSFMSMLEDIIASFVYYYYHYKNHIIPHNRQTNA